MTDHDIAALQGQSFASQLLISICLGKICELMPDPNGFLHEIQTSLIPKIIKEIPNFVHPEHAKTVESSAIGSVGQIAEGARALIPNSKRSADA